MESRRGWQSPRGIFGARSFGGMSKQRKKEEKQASLGIGEASRMLGVSEVTLRNWTNKGRIRFFITPGGHRRYQMETLAKFVAGRRRALRMADLVSRMRETPRENREIAHDSFSRMRWYSLLDEDAHRAFAEYGRKLLAIVVSFVSVPRNRKKALGEARKLGGRFGSYLAGLGLSVPVCIESFLAQRVPILNAVCAMTIGHEAVSRRVAESMPLAMRILDETLIALVEAHQRHAARSLFSETGERRN